MSFSQFMLFFNFETFRYTIVEISTKRNQFYVLILPSPTFNYCPYLDCMITVDSVIYQLSHKGKKSFTLFMHCIDMLEFRNLLSCIYSFLMFLYAFLLFHLITENLCPWIASWIVWAGVLKSKASISASLWILCLDLGYLIQRWFQRIQHIGFNLICDS